MTAETQSAPSLRELSEAATQGEWKQSEWSYDIRAGKTLVGMMSPTPNGNGKANGAFLVALVNAFCAGHLIDPTTLTEAVAAARAEGVREGLERAADICRLWDGPEIVPAVKAVLSDVELDIARRTAGGIADAICALITALPAPARAEGWQPIETAPRDRTRVIVAVPSLHADQPMIVGEAYFNPDHEDGTWWWAGTTYSDYYAGPIHDTNAPPTHWQPLPAPPTTPGGRTDG